MNHISKAYFKQSFGAGVSHFQKELELYVKFRWSWSQLLDGQLQLQLISWDAIVIIIVAIGWFHIIQQQPITELINVGSLVPSFLRLKNASAISKDFKFGIITYRGWLLIKLYTIQESTEMEPELWCEELRSWSYFIFIHAPKPWFHTRQLTILFSSSTSSSTVAK